MLVRPAGDVKSGGFISLRAITLDRNRLVFGSTMTRCDFIALGSGPSGRLAAIQATKLGHAVLVIEKGRPVGVVSVHTGTIPSKTLRELVLNLTG
jgi:ribulose 1,5-bisphosphate synthetase/thiazole synthase